MVIVRRFWRQIYWLLNGTCGDADGEVPVFGWFHFRLVTPDAADTSRLATIYKTQRFSDHAPLMIGYCQTETHNWPPKM